MYTRRDSLRSAWPWNPIERQGRLPDLHAEQFGDDALTHHGLRFVKVWIRSQYYPPWAGHAIFRCYGEVMFGHVWPPADALLDPPDDVDESEEMMEFVVVVTLEQEDCANEAYPTETAPTETIAITVDTRITRLSEKLVLDSL